MDIKDKIRYEISEEYLEALQNIALDGLGWGRWHSDPEHVHYDPTYHLVYEYDDFLMVNQHDSYIRWQGHEYRNNSNFRTLLWIWDIKNGVNGHVI